MAGINIDFVADVSKFIGGTRDIEKSLDGVADSLDELAKEAQRAGDEAGQHLGDGYEEARRRAVDDLEKVADSLDETADESRSAAEKMERSFKDVFDQAKTEARSASDKIGDDVKRGFKRAEDGADEFKDEANSTAREAAASFDGSAESILDAFQEVAANAFAGFGPAGAAAGFAVAAGIGIGVQLLQQAADEAEEAKQQVLDLAEEITNAGGNLADIDMAGRISEWGRAYADVKSWFEPWQEASITNFERMNELIETGAIQWDEYGRAVAGADPEAANAAREKLTELLEAERDAKADLIDQSKQAGQSGGADVAALLNQADARQHNIDLLQQGIDEIDKQNGLTADAIELAGIEQAAIDDTTAALAAQREERERSREALAGLIGAENDYYESLQKAQDVIKENGQNWDASSEAGRENRDAVLEHADAQREYIQSLIDTGTPMGEVASKLQEQRTELMDLATQAGATEKEAQALVDTLLGTPAEIRTSYTLEGMATAQQVLDDFFQDNDGRTIKQYVETVGYSNGPNGAPVLRASGGYVPPGVGGDIDDRYNARLSGGEYVLDKQATDQLGVGILDMLNNGQTPASMAGSGAPSRARIDPDDLDRLADRIAATMARSSGRAGALAAATSTRYTDAEFNRQAVVRR